MNSLILVAPNVSLYEAFTEYFSYFPNVQIVNNYFEWVTKFDCLVSPANSFGMMDGGMDAAITQYFGVSLEERVQDRILEDYLGEQPIGTSLIVETGHPEHPYLAHTPTMRVPMVIQGTDIPYIAMWAMLLAVYQHNKRCEHPIKSVVCPGLGTGIGRVPYREAARQMAVAYDHFLYPPKSLNCFVAATRQLRFGKAKHLLLINIWRNNIHARNLGSDKRGPVYTCTWHHSASSTGCLGRGDSVYREKAGYSIP